MSFPEATSQIRMILLDPPVATCSPPGENAIASTLAPPSLIVRSRSRDATSHKMTLFLSPAPRVAPSGEKATHHTMDRVGRPSSFHRFDELAANLWSFVHVANTPRVTSPVSCPVATSAPSEEKTTENTGADGNSLRSSAV